jgi:hypothetical protein
VQRRYKGAQFERSNTSSFSHLHCSIISSPILAHSHFRPSTHQTLPEYLFPALGAGKCLGPTKPAPVTRTCNAQETMAKKRTHAPEQKEQKRYANRLLFPWEERVVRVTPKGVFIVRESTRQESVSDVGSVHARIVTCGMH